MCVRLGVLCSYRLVEFCPHGRAFLPAEKPEPCKWAGSAGVPASPAPRPPGLRPLFISGSCGPRALAPATAEETPLWASPRPAGCPACCQEPGRNGRGAVLPVGPGAVIAGLRVRPLHPLLDVELARGLRLGWQHPHVQLSPGAHGGWHGGGLQRCTRGGGRAWTVSPAASLVYRLPQSWVGPKLPWKMAHASLHLLAFILTVLGLVAVFRYHNSKHIANLYSLHSWLGITTVFFFACQWLLGFAVFLLPWASPWLRSLLKPVHVFFGASILALAIASVISGINEKLFFSLKNATRPYSSLPGEAVFANSTGMLVVAFGLLVLYLLQASSWKRPEVGATTEGQPLLRERE